MLFAALFRLLDGVIVFIFAWAVMIVSFRSWRPMLGLASVVTVWRAAPMVTMGWATIPIATQMLATSFRFARAVYWAGWRRARSWSMASVMLLCALACSVIASTVAASVAFYTWGIFPTWRAIFMPLSLDRQSWLAATLSTWDKTAFILTASHMIWYFLLSDVRCVFDRLLSVVCVGGNSPVSECDNLSVLSLLTSVQIQACCSRLPLCQATILQFINIAHPKAI